MAFGLPEYGVGVVKAVLVEGVELLFADGSGAACGVDVFDADEPLACMPVGVEVGGECGDEGALMEGA